MLILPVKKVLFNPYPNIGKTLSNTKFSELNKNNKINEASISGTIIKLHFIIVLKLYLLTKATPTNIKNTIYVVGVF